MNFSCPRCGKGLCPSGEIKPCDDATHTDPGCRLITHWACASNACGYRTRRPTHEGRDALYARITSNDYNSL